MSILGDKLNQYIKASGYTVYKLSQISGVNRTTIVRMLNANRLPERKNMENLIPFLKLTPDEKKELWNTYEMMSCGEDIFYQRQYVLSMMLAIFNPPEQKHISAFRAAKVDTGEGFDPIETPCILTGKYEVAHAMSIVILSEEANDILVFAPFRNDFLSEFFGHFSRNISQEVHIRHFMHFIKKPRDITQVNYNLSVLSHVLPLTLADDIDYHAHYSYINNTVDAENDIMFPHFIIIGNMLVELSFDFFSARFTSDPEIVQHYRSTFNKLMLQSSPLVRTRDSFSEMIEDFTPADSIKSGTYVISPQPRMMKIFDKTILSHILRTDKNEQSYFTQIFQNHMSMLTNVKNKVCIFPISGLEELVYEGRIAEMPEQYARPFSLADRLILLERLRVECMKEQCKVRIMNPIKFPMHTKISIQATAERRILLAASNREKNIFRYLEIDEPTLTESLVDFLEYMGTDPQIYSDYIYSREKTLDTIDFYLGKLEEMMQAEE